MKKDKNSVFLKKLRPHDLTEFSVGSSLIFVPHRSNPLPFTKNLVLLKIFLFPKQNIA